MNDMLYYPLDREELTILIDFIINNKNQLTKTIEDEDYLIDIETILEKAKLELNYYNFDENLDYEV